jgi:uracil-DNA glycosylase
MTLALLEFYALSGVDSLIEEEFYDYVAEPVKASPQKQAVILPFTAPVQVASNAADIVREANSLDELKAMLLAFEGCYLKKMANKTIFGMGNPQASIMVIGDAPDADEDREGTPFAGEAGELFTKMMRAININREDIYITPFIPWRPPGNKVATVQEIAVCLPFLKRQIELVKPQFLLIFGTSASNSLLGTSDPILKTRGKWAEYEGVKALATITPATLLKQPLQKKLVWADLLAFKAEALHP